MKLPWLVQLLLFQTRALLVSNSTGAGATQLGPHDQQRDLYEQLKSSVVRIRAAEPDFDWYRPYSLGWPTQSFGTGFIVQLEPYPLFVTNAHVVEDVGYVRVQLLAFGEDTFEGDVVQTCPKFDLALIALRKPQVFLESAKKMGADVRPLRLYQGAVHMGEDVIAAGFAKIDDSIKFHKGTVAGNQEVDGNACIQSTAAISLGFGGGPLVSSDDGTVVGVNFAMATRGDNIYYVIPAWRVGQLVRRHFQDQPKIPSGPSAHRDWKRVHVTVPLTDVTKVQPNDALYRFGGCRDGLYLARIGQRSLFKESVPPVDEGAFLLSVGGRRVDAFGTGFAPEYIADRVGYQDLFYMADDITSDVSFETCRQGTVTKHTVSLKVVPRDPGIELVDEPVMAGLTKEFEIFGGVTVMQMTANFVELMVDESGSPAVSRWLYPEKVDQPRLVVNYVDPTSYAGRVLKVGSAVEALNGSPVRTLAEFREHYRPTDGNVWRLTTDVGGICAMKFRETLEEQVTRAAFGQGHLLTPGARRAAQELGLQGPYDWSAFAASDGGAAGTGGAPQRPRGYLRESPPSRTGPDYSFV